MTFQDRELRLSKTINLKKTKCLPSLYHNFMFQPFLFKLSLFILIFFVQNIFSDNHDIQSLDIDLYSLEELNYDLCALNRAKKIDGPADPSPSGITDLSNREVIPSNYKKELISLICNPLSSTKQSTSIDLKQKAASFLKNNTSDLPNCINPRNQDKCFGQGVVFNGYYLGEWLDNKPHGKGIQLISKVLPFGFTSCMDGVYEGSFQHGRFHGQGSYETCYESYSGNWRNGQMHGFIDWEWPVEYRFGIDFERHSSGYLKLKNVIPFGAADLGGLKKGDIIFGIEFEDQSIETDAAGILSIVNKLKDLPIDQKVSFWIPDAQAQNLLPITISKSMSDPKKSGILLCLETLQEKCYQNSRYQNLYVDQGGTKTRGSYLMGLKHSYELQDIHLTYLDDGSMRWNRYCKNMTPPMNFMSTQREFLRAIKEVTPGVFFFNDDNQSPCKKIFKKSKPQLIFIDLLLENELAINAIEKALSEDADNPLNRFDILDYLNDALSLQNSGKVIPKNHPTQKFCSVPAIASVFCFEWVVDSNNKYQRYILKSLSLIPGTFLSDRRKEMQLMRAEENYIYLRHGLQFGSKNNLMWRNTLHRISDDIINSSRFWDCVYQGDDFATCDRGGYQVRGDKKFLDDYKKLHADHLKTVNFEEWIFGDY